MNVYMFRAGKLASIATSDVLRAGEIILLCRRFKDNWLEQGDWDFDDLPAGATEFVETHLVIRPYDSARPRPSITRRITHALAKREKSEPDTVFIAVVSRDQEKRLTKNMVAERARRLAKIRQRVDEMKPSSSQPVRWEDLPANLQALCRGRELSPDRCWLGRGRWKEANYREFYSRIKGPIPEGVVLRHKCNNRQCMNPNHLEPGTHKENTRDMMERGRHATQRRRTYRGRDEWKK